MNFCYYYFVQSTADIETIALLLLLHVVAAQFAFTRITKNNNTMSRRDAGHKYGALIRVTRLGVFVTFFVTNLSAKVAKILNAFIGLFGKASNLSNICIGYFLATLGKKLASFYSNTWSHWL